MRLCCSAEVLSVVQSSTGNKGSPGSGDKVLENWFYYWKERLRYKKDIHRAIQNKMKSLTSFVLAWAYSFFVGKM